MSCKVQPMRVEAREKKKFCKKVRTLLPAGYIVTITTVYLVNTSSHRLLSFAKFVAVGIILNTAALLGLYRCQYKGVMEV